MPHDHPVLSAADRGLGARTPRLVLAALWLLVVAPVFLGASLWFRDLLIYTYPQKRYAIARLAAGELPVWIDTWGTGRPFFGVLQPGVLDPLNVILLIPGPLGNDLFNFAHLAVAGLGTRAWIRALGGDEHDACAGAALLALSGYLVSMVATNGTYAWGVAFVPWTLAALARGARSADPPALARHLVAVAATLSLALLAGDPMALAFAGAAGLAQSLGEPDASTRRRSFALVALGGALAGMLCAVQLLPAAAVSRTYRGQGVTLRDAGTLSLHPLRLVELLTPEALGAPYTPAWRAPALYTRSARQPIFPLSIGAHQSVALLPLALVALRRRARMDRALWALALASAVLAMGRFTPIWPWCFAHVPGFNLFRGPEKYTFLVSLALAALAARGLPVAVAAPRVAARFALLGAAALGLAAALLPRAGLAAALPNLGPSLLRSALFALGFAAAFHASGWSRLPRGAGRALPLLVIACELLAASLPLIPWTRAEVVRAPSPFVAAIARDRGGDARGARVFRDISLTLPVAAPGAAEAVASLMPNLGYDAGVGHLDAYDAFPATRVRRLRDEVRRTPGALLRWWGVDYAVSNPLGPNDIGLREVAVIPALGLRLARVEGTAPRVYLARDTVPVRGPEEALRAARAPGFTPGETATVEGARRATEGRCVVRRARPEERVIACEARAPGWLIVGESFDPAWSATVNGAPAPIARGNELFLAVPVPAGRATVRLRARASGLREGAVISSLGVLVAVALWAWSRRATR